MKLACRYQLVQSEQWNHRIIAGNSVKVNSKIPEQRQGRRSGVYTVNFEHIASIVLVFSLLA